VLSVLASGTLTADPVKRRSAKGRPYCTGQMRVPVEDGEAVLASFIAFDDRVVTALLELQRGDSCVIAGRGKLSTWTTNAGEDRHGLSVIADRVMSAYVAGRVRKAARDADEVPA
jgi:single-stranded DNA-binding protein